MIRRFSSRQQHIGASFLEERLRGAASYDRIAGYFSSSLLAIAGNALESVSGSVRLVCNSDLDVRDVQTARAAQQAMRQEWCAAHPEEWADDHPERFERLFRLLREGTLDVRVLPREKFGLLHGKAGVITQEDGTQTSFLGSANATAPAWTNNYELLWEDDSNEAVAWVQGEFEALWESSFAVPLAEFVVHDIERLSRRTVIEHVDEWQETSAPAASAAIELPVFREGFGLWEHQKYFVKLAFEAHQTTHGARFVLADMVGLGKTLQLALTAMLVALKSDGPILILAPNPLLAQWQEELREMLDMPSAVWDHDNSQWIDEQGIEHPRTGSEGIRECPRRTGIVSQSRVTFQTEDATHLQALEYACVIVDEAHKARRGNLSDNDAAGDAPDPNNLLSFLYDVSGKTHSLLLATATPVQLRPVEAWDLLDVLSRGSEEVLGNMWSNWRDAGHALDVVMGEEALPRHDDWKLWRWVRNPLPPAREHPTFQRVRRALGLSKEEAIAAGDAWNQLRPPEQQKVRRLHSTFAQHHNPFIRHIVRRTRGFLEDNVDPSTGEPYMDKIEVVLHGEKPGEAIPLPVYLEDAYQRAKDFCTLLGRRSRASGFMQTLLLRRVGSTIYAGHKTAQKMLREWPEITESQADQAPAKALTPSEKDALEAFERVLRVNTEEDPKYQNVVGYLVDREWLEEGCIVFSQYYDSIEWLARRLSTEALPDEKIGIYAARKKSGIMRDGRLHSRDRDELKAMVRRGEIRLLLGTQSASEGLNLQRLSTLINLDLPWNPTRLEQRKGRIQRIGQRSDEVHVYNMRYRGSVEEKVHEMLSERLENIHTLFGQVPDVLEDAWINVALDREAEARATIDHVPDQHPFEMRYEQIEHVDWESCAEVLEQEARREVLSRGW